MKTLDDFDFLGKKVLVRSDLNCDVVSGKVIESERIKASVKTIKELKKKGAMVVIIAHQGREGREDFVSLKQHTKLLNKYVDVDFVDSIYDKNALERIKSMKKGDVLLLENLRFLKGEEDLKKTKYVKPLAEHFDFYVNDAFSVCHRKHASIVEFPKLLKSAAGRLLEKEVESIKSLKIKDCLYILGGAKPEDNMKLIKSKKVLACGLFGQMCLIARGKDLGEQNKYLEKKIDNFKKTNKVLKKKLKGKKVLTPIDFAVSVNGKRKEIALKDFPCNYEIFDIGKKTQKMFVEEIKKAKAVYMKGPAGYCADKKFCKGTKKILKTIVKQTKRGMFSLIGGGHLSDAMNMSGVNEGQFSHVSLSGGALLNYIAGKKLPGLELLK